MGGFDTHSILYGVRARRHGKVPCINSDYVFNLNNV
jgi:hypothetical protein